MRGLRHWLANIHSCLRQLSWTDYKVPKSRRRWWRIP